MFLAPKFFRGESPPNFWSGIIKFSQIPTIHVVKFQGARSRDLGERVAKKKKTSAVKHKPVWNGGSGRPDYDCVSIYENRNANINNINQLKIECFRLTKSVVCSRVVQAGVGVLT